MTKSKYTRHIERNEILTKYYDHLMPKEDKQEISSSANTIIRRTRAMNKKAKIGKVGALEILYELGRFLNRIEE